LNPIHSRLQISWPCVVGQEWKFVFDAIRHGQYEKPEMTAVGSGM
jgi:hypothetical protein